MTDGDPLVVRAGQLDVYAERVLRIVKADISLEFRPITLSHVMAVLEQGLMYPAQVGRDIHPDTSRRLSVLVHKWS